MRDRLRGYRITCLASGALGFLAGFAARSEFQRRLQRKRAAVRRARVASGRAAR